MKKILLLIIFYFGVLTINCFSQSATTIYTPKGSSLTAYNSMPSMSAEDKSDWSDYVDYYYPSATEIDAPSATYDYNCHGYAWHVSEGGSDVWIGLAGYDAYPEDVEDIYWTDGSYVETTEPYASKVSYYEDNHSAIQTSTQGVYRSKWGSGPLMQHARDYGPAVYLMDYRKYYKLQPEINGTFTALCYNSERTFTSNMSISGSSYTWTRDNSLLDYVSGAGTTSYRVKGKSTSGDAWIQFQITTPSGEVATRTKWVWANKPVINYLTGPSYGYTDNTYYFYPIPSYEQRALSSYSWNLDPLNSNYVNGYVTGYAYITFYDADNYVVVSKADNLCGSTGWKMTYIEIEEGYKFLISPNPASERVNVKVTTYSTSSEELEIPEFNIRILDMNGITYFNEKRSGFDFNLPVSKLREGTYIVNIKYGDKSESIPLLIKH